LTLVLLDTNVYLRLAKRVRPLLGTPFGSERFELTILKDVENEVHRNSTLSFYYPWFDGDDFVKERLAKQIRLSEQEKSKLEIVKSVLHGSVKGDSRYLTNGRSPPSQVDCRVLAFSQIRTSIIVTDDEGMHLLAHDYQISVWYGYQLLEKMWKAQMIDEALIRSIYEALENNDDMTKAWEEAKHTTFIAIFGNV